MSYPWVTRRARARIAFFAISWVFATAFVLLLGQDPSAAKLSEALTQRRLQAFSRLSPDLYATSDRVKALIDETARALQTDPRLLELVTRFGILGHSEALIEIAILDRTQTVSHRITEHLLESPETTFHLKQRASEPEIQRLLAENGSIQATTLLVAGLALNESRAVPALTNLVPILCQTKQGTSSLLSLMPTFSGSLQTDLARLATASLVQTPWSDLRTAFRKWLPSSEIVKEQAPEEFIIADLVKKTGDPRRGHEVFLAPEHTCVNCHQVDDNGKNFGPGLSDIGTKLGKDALFDAILNPSAGISFDYEGWDFTLQNGDEVTGIILSESESEITLKNLASQQVTMALSEVFDRQKMSTSLMPPGLGALLGESKLIDLVAYLSQLRRPPTPSP